MYIYIYVYAPCYVSHSIEKLAATSNSDLPSDPRYPDPPWPAAQHHAAGWETAASSR